MKLATQAPPATLTKSAAAPVTGRLFSRPTITHDEEPGNGLGAHNGGDPADLFTWEAPSRFDRTLEAAQIVSGVAANYATGVTGLGVSGLSAVTGAVTVVTGLNDLREAKSGLDYLSTVGSLALGADSLLTSSFGFRGVPISKIEGTAKTVSTGLGILYGLSDLVVGSADCIKGMKEKDNRYTAAGLLQASMGASVLAAVIFPQFGPIADAVLVGSLMGRDAVFASKPSSPANPTSK